MQMATMVLVAIREKKRIMTDDDNEIFEDLIRLTSSDDRMNLTGLFGKRTPPAFI